jgi:glycosyltransferase involved in cell wall biosynthesis
MRIGLDARWIFPEITGIGSYTRELIRHLALADPENDYVLLFADEALRDRTCRDCLPQAPANVSSVRVPYGLFSPAGQVRMPGVIRRLKLDVFHSPNYMIPLAAFPRRGRRPGAARAVVTIHDLIPLIFPDYVPRSRKRRLFFLYRWLMRDIARRADVIITVSRASRADVIRHLGLPSERHGRVAVVTEGVSPRFQPPPERPAPPRDAPRTILWVGRADPYKNLAVLIEAFARLRGQVRLDVRLKLVGPPDARYPEADRLARQLGVAPHIERAGYLADDALVRAYQEADVFALPSRYEGFGLTVLEAMACGVPVVCSNKGSLPEVAGQAAILVQPSDVVGLSEALKRVLLDPRTARDMRRRGLERARTFTWDQTARQTLDAYRLAMTPP